MTERELMLIFTMSVPAIAGFVAIFLMKREK